MRKPNVLAAARLNVTSLATPGNSGTPLARKLGVKAGGRMLMIAAPDGYDALVAPLPRELALPLGFVGIKVCAVTAVWSGLELVLRRELR